MEEKNIHIICFSDMKSAVCDLYQYDKGQIMLFDEKFKNGTEVQFENKMVKAIIDNQIVIPDAVLETAGVSAAWIQVIEEDNETTIYKIILKITPRAKKNDYVEPEDEQSFREEVQKMIEEAGKPTPEEIDPIVKDYLEKNPPAPYDDSKIKADISALQNDKQNNISDLEEIRSGASKGATALQSIPSEYAKKSDIPAPYDDTEIREEISEINTSLSELEDRVGVLERGGSGGGTEDNPFEEKYWTDGTNLYKVTVKNGAFNFELITDERVEILLNEVATMPNTLGIGKFIYDGSKYLYAIGSKRITKYNFADATNPTQSKYISIATEILSGTSNQFKNAEIVGNYLYVVSRTSQANLPDRTKTNGRLYIVDLTSFAISQQIDFDRKPSDLVHYNANGVDYLFINMQMCGWAIYDISTNPTSPTIVYNLDLDGSSSNEFQRGGFYTDGVNQYYVAYGFADGIRFYNINNISNPTLVKQITRADVGKRGGNGGHFYNGIIEYPYMYATYANSADILSSLTDDNNEAGIIVLNIADLNNITYENVIIPTEYAVKERSGDTQPTDIFKFGDKVFINNYTEGMEVYTEISLGHLKPYGHFVAKNSNAVKNAVDTMLIVGDYLVASDGSLRDADGKSMSQGTYGEWHVYDLPSI